MRWTQIALIAVGYLAACRFDGNGIALRGPEGGTDRSTDWPRHDRLSSEQRPDGSLKQDRDHDLHAPLRDGLPLDRAADQPAPDQLVPDSRPADRAEPDRPSPDLREADLLLPDAAPALPCAIGKMTFQFQPDMVICTAGSPYNQCGAAAVCNQSGGWHLCTAAEYQARSGKTTQPPAAAAWIASCVRSGKTAAHAPTNAICSSCAGSPQLGWITVAWECGGPDSFSREDPYVGVATKELCRAVGVNTAANQAYWSIAVSSATFYRSVCCR